ncbi:hypothetical protein BDW71DRAFT_214413 [Aspergillus fruticulosus]
MSTTEKCTVLVIGGGPASSCSASVFARGRRHQKPSGCRGEPGMLRLLFHRYHIWESLLPSIHYYLELINLYDKFNSRGFIRKTGASFKLNYENTDFLAANGASHHSWNVVRSEADDLIFKNAHESGIYFDSVNGRPVLPGTIRFEYLVGASGRAGVVSTKYLRNRGYWTGAKMYGPGWKMHSPRHLRASRKKACESTSTLDFYLNMLKETLIIANLIRSGRLRSNMHLTMPNPGLRIAGDAGGFIDALLSCGVHLAVDGWISAALFICASLRGHGTEEAAIKWHIQRVTEGYTRFLMSVKSLLDQVHGRDEYILNYIEEPAGFNIACKYPKPSRREISGRLTGHAGSGFHLDKQGGENNGDDIMLKVARLERVVSFSEVFPTDVIDGMAPKMRRGELGLIPVAVRT